MTPEEAIKMITDDMQLHHDYLSGNYRKALRMAIEALKAHDVPDINVGDMISRQTAIDMLESAQYSVDFCKEHGIDRSINMEMVRIRLNSLPSAQPEPHWIPCNKDRPKNNQEVLICDIKGNVVQAVYLADVCMWYILRWNRGIKFEMTKAWMPMPKPYSEDEE